MSKEYQLEEEDEGNSTSTPEVTRQITNVAAGTEDTDAVNVAQLKRVAASAGGSLNFGGDNTTATANIITVNSGEQLNVKGGVTEATELTDNNIGIVADKTTKTLNVKLSNKVNLNDSGHLSIGNVTDENGQTVVDQNGITIYPSTSETEAVVTKLTKNGISAGNQKIKYVAAGEADEDAVNVSQLKAARVELQEGTNTKLDIDTTTAEDGHTIYTVNVDDLKYKVGTNDAKSVKLQDGLTFNATHNKVTGGIATEASDSSNAVSLTLTDEDGNTIPAIALQNTYTAGVTYDATNKKATFTRNDGQSYDLSLKEMGATDYRLVKNVSSTDGSYEMAADGTVTVNVQDQVNGTTDTVSIKGLVTQSDVAKAKTEVKDGRYRLRVW